MIKYKAKLPHSVYTHAFTLRSIFDVILLVTEPWLLPI